MVDESRMTVPGNICWIVNAISVRSPIMLELNQMNATKSSMLVADWFSEPPNPGVRLNKRLLVAMPSLFKYGLPTASGSNKNSRSTLAPKSDGTVSY